MSHRNSKMLAVLLCIVLLASVLLQPLVQPAAAGSSPMVLDRQDSDAGDVDPQNLLQTRPSQTPTPGRWLSPTPTATATIALRNTLTPTVERWRSPTPTATPERYRSPTPTRTPARPTAPPTITPTPVTTDLYVTDLEVTQAIQDLNDSVPLIAGKRTFVRAHVRANDGNHSGILGEFKFGGGGHVTGWLPADNPGGGRIKVREWPGRGFRDNSYFIEVPPKMLGAGVITILFRMNNDQAVLETSYLNNGLFKAATMESSPPAKVKIYNIIYAENNSWQAASVNDILKLVSWLRRAYPVPYVNWQWFSVFWPDGPTPSAYGCEVVNSWLAWHRILDGKPAGWHYYGLVTDTGSWMRGCAVDIPSYVASGPTGMGTWGWDTDGSYGDWYGAHELGHTYGRFHTACSGSEAGADGNYPYPGGKIGVPGDGNTFYGWDSELLQVYPPYWADVMSYCSWQWISDYTYLGIRSRLKAEAGVSVVSAALPLTFPDYLAVFGVANVTKGTADLHALYRLPEITDPDPQVPSDDWALVLYGTAGEELASYSFTPKQDTEREEGEDLKGAINETVPWVEGTTRIAVEYLGAEVASQAVSANEPTVALTYPNGGESLDGSEVTVRWNGHDDDGDDLTYTLLYSSDAGSSWRTVTSGVRGNEVVLPLGEFPGSEQALLRIIVADGVHTGEDVSDGTFSVAGKAPQAFLLLPLAGSSYTSEQQVVLVGEGYDVEDGNLADAALSWSSDLQGNLGTGRNLAVTDLDAGIHEITLEITDSDAQSAIATTFIYVDVPLKLIMVPLVMKS